MLAVSVGGLWVMTTGIIASKTAYAVEFSEVLPLLVLIT